MTDSDFIQLLERFEAGSCSVEEQVQLEQWLKAMKEGSGPFESKFERDRIKMVLKESIYRKASITSEMPASVKPIREPRIWVPRALSPVYRIAASVLILVTIGFGLYKFDVLNLREKNMAMETSSGSAITKVLLADGSIVWLKPNSKLIYPEQFQGTDRVVSLQGEGLFEITKDSLHPFIIHSGGLTTRVLGTSFNIRTTPKGTEVYVLTGKVSVSSQHNKENIELLPTEKVLYSNTTLQKVKGESVAQSRAIYTKGTQYEMFFQGTPINDVAKQIKDKFNVRLTIQGDIQNCILTADLTDQSLESTMDLVSEALNAKYEVDGDRVVLTGNGCD